MKKSDISYSDLCDFSLNYKDVLNIPTSIKFGAEIEFSDASLDDVSKIIEQKMNKGSNSDPFLKWVVKSDGTVTTRKTIKNKYYYQNIDASWEDPKQNEYMYENEEISFGGEVNTPILHDTKSDWLNLKEACSYLRQMEDIRINEKCALHFHTDKNIFKRPIEFFRYLELRVLYQDIIYRFGYGISKTPRNCVSRYAKPFGIETISMIKEILRLGNKNLLNWYDALMIVGLDRYLGFSVYNINSIDLITINHRQSNLKNTYEDRNFNGNLYETIIQNDFEFSIRLKLLCQDDALDWDRVDSTFMDLELSDFIFSAYVDFDKAFELASMLYKSDTDILRFMKQYMKAFTDYDKENFKVIDKQYKL